MADDLVPCDPSLKGIPFEVRNQILQPLLQSDNPIFLTFNSDGYFRLPADQDAESANSLGLLSASSQLYDETTAIFYGANQFVVPWSTELVSQRTYNLSSAKYLRRLEIRCVDDGPFFGFAPVINALAEGAPDHLNEVIISFQDAARLLACVFELTNAVTECSFFHSPTLEFVLAPLKENPPFSDDTGLATNINLTMVRPNASIHGLHQFSAPYGKYILSTSSAPGLRKITIVGPIVPGFIPIFESHKCGAGQCQIEKLSFYQETNNLDDLTTNDRRHYVWKKKDHIDVLPDPNMRQWLPPLPKKYRDQLCLEFNLSSLDGGCDAEPVDGGLPSSPDNIRTANGLRSRGLSYRLSRRARMLGLPIGGPSMGTDPSDGINSGVPPQPSDAGNTAVDANVALHGVQAQFHEPSPVGTTGNQVDATTHHLADGNILPDGDILEDCSSSNDSEASSINSNGNSANNVPNHGIPQAEVMDWIANSATNDDTAE